MLKARHLTTYILLVFSWFKLNAQVNDSLRFKTKVVGLPVVFYSPETKLGVGVAGFLSFKTKGLDTNLRASKVDLLLAYTQEKQVLSLFNYDIWFDKNNYNIYGELGYYRYFYYFYGIGNTGDKYEEAYNVNYPRIRFTLDRQIKNGWYAGLKFVFDDFNITKLDSTAQGRLINKSITGANGGKISGLGLSLKYDTRDNNFYPTNGWKASANTTVYNKAIASDFNYTASEFNIVKYLGFGKDRVLALNTYGRFINKKGNAPFFHLSRFGSGKEMRGYYNGYFRDKHLLAWQAEYRTPVWKRFGLVAFAGNAVVANTISNFKSKHIKTTAGAGVRFKIDKERKINLRLDYGISKEGSGFYFTIGESF